MPDYRKSIIFQAKMDTAEVSAAVENMKRQFQDLSRFQAQAQTSARLSQQGYTGFMPKAEDISKNKTAFTQFIREQAQEQEKLFRKIKEEISLEQNLNREKERGRQIDERSLALKQETIRILDQEYKNRENVLRNSLNLSGGRPQTGGGDRNLLSGADWSGVMPKGGPGGAAYVKGIGSISAVIAGVAKAVDTLAGFPMRLEEAKGVAAQSFVGRDIQALQSGNAPFETPWMAERAKAAEMAKTRAGWRHVADIGMGIAGAGLIAGGGLAAATGVGLPLAGGMIAGGGALLSNDRFRNSINPFGQGAYNQLAGAQQGQDTLSTWEALRQQDPRKGAAIDRLQGRFSGDLNFQRMTGLGYGGFSEFQGGANKAGFNGDLAMAMAAQIQGGGGSTRGMTGLSTLGLQAQRGFDLTNAGGVLGKISGTVGGAGGSEQVFRRLMEESIKAGLDKSDFREEQRRFADNAAEILSQSGVRSAADAAASLSGFTKFLGNEPTMKDIAGARSVYDQTQALSSTTSGRGGALHAAGFLRDPLLRKLGTQAIGDYMNQDIGTLNESNPDIIADAKLHGTTPAILAATLRKEKQDQQYTLIGANKKKVQSIGTSINAQNRARELLGGKPISDQEIPDYLNEDQLRTYADIQHKIQYGIDYKDSQTKQAAVRGLTGLGGGGPFAGAANAGAPGVEARLTGTTGRPEDEVFRATGVAAQAMLDNFRKFKDVITPTTQSLTGLIDAVMALKTAADMNTKDSLGRYINSMPGSLKTQIQAGKPSPRGTGQ